MQIDTAVVVLAGTTNQFEDYVQDYVDEAHAAWRLGPGRWWVDGTLFVYPTSLHSLHGLRFDAYVLVGHFSDRPDAGDVMSAVLLHLR